MKTRYALLGVLIGLLLSSCIAIQTKPLCEAKSVGVSVDFPKRERREAEHLLRVIYTPSRSGYSLKFIPDESILKQTVKDLKARLRQIRAVPGNIAFKLIISDKTGADVSTLSGIFQRDTGDIQYTTDKALLDNQPINVRLNFLAWYEHSAVVSFYDNKADNFRSEHFETVHGSKLFKMTLSAEAIVDPPFTSEE